MKIVTDAATFRAEQSWGARDLAEIDGVATVRLHWTDEPYIWHRNDQPELFCVISGQVEMDYRQQGQEKTVTLIPGNMFIAEPGDEHRARPVGEARILVVERKGAI